MATLARYIFNSSSEAEYAMEQLWRQLSGGFSRGGNEIYIDGDCSNPQLALKICQACGGKIGG